MSSNQNKTKSIAHKFQWYFFRKKLGIYIVMDLCIALLLICGWVYLKECDWFGSFHWTRFSMRGFGFQGGIHYAAWKNGELVFTQACKSDAIIFAVIMGYIMVIQIIGLFASLYSDYRKSTKLLKPIDDLAIKADKLSRMTFSEDKYVEIEQALDQIGPDEESKIHLNDPALEGIEAAVNNMLLRMRESYKQQARFVNDASHELRTPIAVIQGYANMLERWGKSDEKVLDESVDAIVHEADHMNKLVEQLLFLARGDSGRTTLSLANVSLNQMMQEIYEESFMIDEAHPYRLRNSEEEITVEADATLLKQAVRILIDNAAKYTKEKDEIILGYGRNEEGRPYLMVEDTGIGMAEADVQHMFERFYRSDEVRNFQGTGLGLSIAKWIVDKHKGHFDILSRTDLGTRITIIL